ncbi:S-layer homology domain-containing protein [Paenibacillus sp. sgz500958]|uniref:S-layer homology domain-containing protein n=1 Tax=Paenibacillus sp. sgz500958 TaxID=3242475 RepID=UPI0036D38CF8
MKIRKSWLAALLSFVMVVTMLIPVGVSHASSTPTTLSPGDIGIVGINAKDPYPAQRWAFVILRDIGSGTIVHFTDASIYATGNFSADLTSEGHMTWTVPTDLTAGKLFIVTNNPSSNAAIVDASGTSYTGVNGSLGGSISGFSGNGDQIFVHQGTRSSTSGATFIYAFNNANGSEYITNGSWITTGNIAVDRLSYAPSATPIRAMNAFTSNISGTPQGVYGCRDLEYKGPKVGSQSVLLAAMGDPNNWSADHVKPYNDFASIGNFTVTPDMATYYSVTYDGNGSTGGTVPVDGLSYGSVDTVNVLGNTGNLVNTGNTFLGWNTTADGTGTDYRAGDTFVMGTANVTLYAKWTTSAIYKVTYNANGSTGGTAPSDTNNYVAGSSVTVLGNTGNLTMTNYTFAGWNTASDGTGADYEPTNQLVIGSSNVTLYAKWAMSPRYTISYNGNGSTGGTVPFDNNTYTASTKVTVLGNTGNLIRAGYTFQGWNSTPNEFSSNYQPSSQYTMTANNATLYAKWKPDSTERLVVQSGFESNVTAVTNDQGRTSTFAGSDQPLSTFSWDNLNGDLNYGNYYRDPSLSTYSIVPDPLDPNNKVAKFTVVNYGADSASTTLNGRAQGSFSMGKQVGRNEIYNTLHVKYRQYFSPDYEALKDITPENSDGLAKWTDLFEIWTPPSPDSIASQLDHVNAAGAFRINFEFEPNYDKSLNGGFTWHLRGEDMDFKNSDGYRQWLTSNSSVPVPFGKWAEWDIYVVKGADPKVDSTSSARVIVKMKVEGEQEWVTLFNETNERTQHSWISNEGYYQAGIFKNYLGPGTVKFLKDMGKQDISLYFDDLSFWVDTAVPPPQHEVLATVIVDNADSGSNVTKSGSWTASSASNLRYGPDYWFIYPSPGGSYVKFQPDLPSAGTYRIRMKNAPDLNRADNAQVDIVNANGTTTVHANQKYNATIELGEYTFKKGTEGSVTVRNDNANGRIVADAIEFQLITPIAPSSITAPEKINVTKAIPSALTGVSFTGSGSNMATSLMSVANGTLSTVSGNGITVSGSGTSALTLTGTIANLNTFLAANNVLYTAVNWSQNVDMSIALNDGISPNVSTDVTICVRPEVPIVTGVTEGATYSAAVTPGWTDPAGTSSEASLSKDGGASQPFTKGTALSANGVYALQVTNTSEANGLTATTTLHFTINTTAPASPIVTGVTEGATYNSAVTPGWTDPAGTSSEASLSKDGGASQPFTKGTALSANGVYALQVTNTRTANGLTATTTLHFTINTTAPASPIVTGVTEGATYSAAVTPGWTDPAGTSSEASLSKDGGASQPFTKGTALSANGVYALQVTNTRTANGLTATTTLHFTINTTAPASPIVTGVTEGATYSAAVTPGWTDPAGTSSEASLSKDGGASQPFTKGTALSANGVYALQVTNTRTANGLTATTTLHFTINTTAPASPIVTGVTEGATYSAAVTPGWTDPAGTSSEASLSKDGGASQPFTKGTALSANGVYALQVTNTRTANGLTATTTLHFTINTTAPASPIVTGVTEGATYSAAVTPGWTDPAGTSSEASLSKDGGASQPFTKGTALSANGVYALQVTSTRTANGLTATTTLHFTIRISVAVPDGGSGFISTQKSLSTPLPNQVDVDDSAIKLSQGKNQNEDTAVIVSVANDQKFIDSFIALKEKLVKNPTSLPPIVNVYVDSVKPGQSVVVDISANNIKNAIDEVPNAKLDIKTNNISYELPLQLFDTSVIAKQLGTTGQNLTFNVSIEPLTGKDREAVNISASKAKLNPVTSSIRFSVTAEEGGKKMQVVHNGNANANASLTIQQTISGNQATVFGYNPTTGEFDFVPAAFKSENTSTVVTFKADGNNTYTIMTAVPKVFADLGANGQTEHWAKTDIDLLSSKHIVNGVTDNAFAPDANTSRAEFTTLLVRSLGLSTQTGPSNFKDVSATDWYAAAANAAVSANLMEGFADQTFRPNEQITREQMAVMLLRAIEASGRYISLGNQTKEQILAQFKDSGTVSTWSNDAMAKLVTSGLLRGTDDVNLSPGENATRAQATVLLKRFLQYVNYLD